MHWPRIGYLVVALSTVAAIAHAEAAPTRDAPAERPSNAGQEVRADDLALGRPLSNAAPTQPPDAASSNDVLVGPQLVAPELAHPATLEQKTPVTGPTVAPSNDELSARPKRLPYNGEAEMPGYQRQEQRRWWMIGLGGALFGLGYIGGIAIGVDHDFRNSLGFTAIPLAGPWVALGMREDCKRTFECSNSDDDSLAAVGVIQDIGGVLLAIGLATTREVWVRDDVAWGLRPLVGRGQSGLQLSGTF